MISLISRQLHWNVSMNSANMQFWMVCGSKNTLGFSDGNHLMSLNGFYFYEPLNTGMDINVMAILV